MPSGSVTGVMSLAQKPSAIAFSARFWLRTPNSSSSWRERPRMPGDVLGGLAHRDVGVGQLAVLARVVPVLAALGGLSVRAAASSKSGFWVSGRWSEVPLAKRETVSTPALMKTSPSPALMAWKAIRVVCTEEEQ